MRKSQENANLPFFLHIVKQKRTLMFQGQEDFLCLYGLWSFTFQFMFTFPLKSSPLFCFFLLGYLQTSLLLLHDLGGFSQAFDRALENEWLKRLVPIQTTTTNNFLRLFRSAYLWYPPLIQCLCAVHEFNMRGLFIHF